MKKLLFILLLLPVFTTAQFVNQYGPYSRGKNTYQQQAEQERQRKIDSMLARPIGKLYNAGRGIIKKDDTTFAIDTTLVTTTSVIAALQHIMDSTAATKLSAADSAKFAARGSYITDSTATAMYQPKLGYTPLRMEVDSSNSNELQALSVSGYSLSISSGNTVSLPYPDSTKFVTVSALPVVAVTGSLPISVTAGNRPVVSISNAVANNSTKGAASFDSTYFSSSAGNVSMALKYGTATVSAGAVTINAPRGRVVMGTPTLLAGITLNTTLTNSFITATSTINVQINGSGNTINVPLGCFIKSQTAGSCVISIVNISLLNALNTGFAIDFLVTN